MNPSRLPLVVALDMGYGHLRPAHAIARRLGTEVRHADRPPLAGDDETALWRRIRRLYYATTRWSSVPGIGAPFRRIVESATDIPHLHPYRDQSRPVWAVRRLHRSIERGLGRRMVETLRESGRPLVTTYFAPALAADAAGLEDVYCVVTDADIHRVWAPLEPARTKIRYLVPSMRALRRLRAYGVPRERIAVTGHPLPHELVGGATLDPLERHLAARLVRLDRCGSFRAAHGPEIERFLGPLPAAASGPPRITFAVGGAGAQTDIVRKALPGLAPALRDGSLEICLVAGTRPEVAARFAKLLRRLSLEERVEVLYEADVLDYFDRFHRRLAETDVLWTKPSEMTFFGALGLAMVLAPPVGVQEWYNRRWARESGAALKQRDARHAAQWLSEWLDDGLLASAAWCGYLRLPKLGTDEVVRHVTGAPPAG